MKAYVFRKFKMPTIKGYDGTGDPTNHIWTFSNALLLQPVSDAVKCRAFSRTLGGMAQRWYSRLSPNSIWSFIELSRAFIGQFISGKNHEKSSVSLINLLQGRNESLRDYINRSTKEPLKVPDLDEKVAMIALQQETTDTFFKMSLAKQVPDDMNAFQERAGKYIKAEESLRKETHEIDNISTKKQRNVQKYDVGSKYTKSDKSEDSTPENRGEPKFTEYARLNTAQSQILMEIEKDKDIKWPKSLRTEGERKNQHLYCRFHKDNGHNTDDCRQIKDEIEFLIRKGKLAIHERRKRWKQ